MYSSISPFSLNQSIGEFYDSESSSEASEDEDTQDRRPVCIQICGSSKLLYLDDV